MWITSEEVAPFTQIEVKWKLKGTKANEADWIGMYEGVEIPDDIDVYASSMMATGQDTGKVKFTAPNHPGLHHFRYFLLDDTEAAVSAAFYITKLDKADAAGDVHVRDAINAENEVLKIEGKYVESEEEEEYVDEATGETKIKKTKKKRKAKGDGSSGATGDMTGFETYDESVATSEVDKVKEQERMVMDEKNESVMNAATNYVKKIPTKKEMREADKKQNKVDRSSQEDGAAPGGGAKKTGWGAVRKAAGGGAFVQGRAGQDSGKRAGAKKKKEVSEDMGSFTVNRSKK